MTYRAGFISRLYWRILRLFGFGKSAWDDQFKKGLWSRGRHSDYFINKIISLSRGGSIVEFGCAEGILVDELPIGSFDKYFGYDISEVAVDIARNAAKGNGFSNCIFEQRDMSQWPGCSGVSLILLEECLYYLNVGQVKEFLGKCKTSLLPDGVILVIVHSADKHVKTLDACRSTGHVIEELLVGNRVFMTLGK